LVQEQNKSIGITDLKIPVKDGGFPKDTRSELGFRSIFYFVFFAIEKNEKTNQAKDYGKEAQCP